METIEDELVRGGQAPAVLPHLIAGEELRAEPGLFSSYGRTARRAIPAGWPNGPNDRLAGDVTFADALPDLVRSAAWRAASVHD